MYYHHGTTDYHYGDESTHTQSRVYARLGVFSFQLEWGWFTHGTVGRSYTQGGGFNFTVHQAKKGMRLRIASGEGAR